MKSAAGFCPDSQHLAARLSYPENVHRRPTHLARVALAVEQNEAENPVGVRMFSANALAFEPNPLVYDIQKPGLVVHGSMRHLHFWAMVYNYPG